jgi:hypothetical protein
MRKLSLANNHPHRVSVTIPNLIVPEYRAPTTYSNTPLITRCDLMYEYEFVSLFKALLCNAKFILLTEFSV